MDPERTDQSVDNDASFLFDSLLSESDTNNEEAVSSGGELQRLKCKEPASAKLAEFSAEDVAFRDELRSFYSRHNPANMSNVDALVSKHRGGGVSHLWVQLAMKYNIPAVHVLDFLARTLYVTSPFQCGVAESGNGLDDRLRAIGGASLSASNLGSFTGDVLRVHVCCGGVELDSSNRPLVWKALLGYLPLSQSTQWPSIEQEKRVVYQAHRLDLLDFDDGVATLSSAAASGDSAAQNKDLLEVLRIEAENTGSGNPFFEKQSTRTSLVAILFVYAHLNPSIRYVQGMSEVAGVLLSVMMGDEPSLDAEADAFWCFSLILEDMKDLFLQDIDQLTGTLHALIGNTSSLLSKYDPDLAAHLSNCDLEPGIFGLRWFRVFFSQDLALADVVRLWDAVLADPFRFRLVGHFCVAIILSCRDELLATRNVVALASIMQGAPQRGDMPAHIKRALALYTLERREQSPTFPPPSTVDVLQEAAGAFIKGFFQRF